ncbi:hypothetical protein P9273_27145 [Mesorhizobium sp. WSM4935]|uniref:hypothetical protein n=1 Tax=Mesorhizobium sp. WSM4935 TaxID=3038547 RepID=UPI0024155921|nr:hypothetical protein [Mesorhizobium sp. WSM4935]MDG4878759.1 hypothetical protein [Mesorhizobium sp. WSM4935]
MALTLAIAFAHGADQVPGGGWPISGMIVIPLGLALLLYIGGVLRLWRQAGVGRGVAWWHRPASRRAGQRLLRPLCLRYTN